MKEIKLTQGKVALVDDKDFEYLNQFKWYAGKKKRNFYAYRKKWIDGGQKTIIMHRVIMNTPKGMEADHKDGNGLNNQEYNLRNCTTAQNTKNRRISKSNNKSGYKGVYWKKSNKTWVAQIKNNYREIYIGCFQTKEGAARAYNEKAVEFYGEFANLNKIGHIL